MIKQNTSAIIPIHKACDIEVLINSIKDLVTEIIIINSSQKKFLFDNPIIKIFNYDKKLNASESRNLGIEKASKEILFKSKRVLSKTG